MTAPTLNTRASGLLLHLTSLPGPVGSGDLGGVARFIDDLVESGQCWWQMLPINPPSRPPGNSPYSSCSAYAGSPWLIDLKELVERGLLDRANLNAPANVNSDKTFAASVKFRERVLRKAFANEQNSGALSEDCKEFREREKAWLADWTLYAALKEHFNDLAWDHWPKKLRTRDPKALAEAREKFADEIAYHEFVQYQFDRQWRAFKQRANNHGIGLVGDVPIFVSHDSADVWAKPELFLLDKSGHPTVVSGYPPDPFTKDGQKWGHPHYNWSAHRRNRFAWWVARFAKSLEQFDAVRIDHFLGFHRAYAIPAKAPNARKGKWLTTPGEEIFSAIRAKLGKAAIIAEDLGTPTPEALRLRDKFRFPGMRVVQFAFGDDDYHRPHAFPRNCVAYTGTHDNDTTVGWYERVKKFGNGELTRVESYTAAKPKSAHWDFIRLVSTSVADTVIFPVQDVLGLGSQHRMNIPGTPDGNWTWRMERPLPAHVKKKLRELTETAGRADVSRASRPCEVISKKK